MRSLSIEIDIPREKQRVASALIPNASQYGDVDCQRDETYASPRTSEHNRIVQNGIAKHNPATNGANSVSTMREETTKKPIIPENSARVVDVTLRINFVNKSIGSINVSQEVMMERGKRGHALSTRPIVPFFLTKSQAIFALAPKSSPVNPTQLKTHPLKHSNTPTIQPNNGLIQPTHLNTNGTLSLLTIFRNFLARSAIVSAIAMRREEAMTEPREGPVARAND